MSERDKRILLIGVPVILLILIIRFVFMSDSAASSAKPVGQVRSAPLAEKQLVKYRQMAALVPAKQALFEQADAERIIREKGVLVADTAPQAQARLLEIGKRVAKSEGIDLKGSELGQVRPLGSYYGEATVAVTFECHIEQFVNFMASLSREPELIAPDDLRVNTANAKEKTITVRMTLGGMVPKKMVPEKKGFSLY